MTFVSPVSTIPEVKAFLVDAIESRPEIEEPTLVSYGEPSTYMPADVIAVTNSTQNFSVAAMVGSGATHWLDENYMLDVVVESFLGGDDAKAAEERALYLTSVVIDVVRSDPSLGGLVIQARPASMNVVGAWEEDHKGRKCQVTLSFEILAQL